MDEYCNGSVREKAYRHRLLAKSHSSVGPQLEKALPTKLIRIAMGIIEEKFSSLHAIEWFLLFLSTLISLRAEQLPIKTYTTADGLAGNRVSQIMRDSHGFLWVCTYEGISRYDGYMFTNYKVVSGPVQPEARSFLETRSGVCLAATKTGVYQFHPAISSGSRWGTKVTSRMGEATESLSPETRFERVFPRKSEGKVSTWALAEDQGGKIWAGTAVGLYQMEWSDGKWTSRYIDIGLPRDTEDDTVVRALLRDRQGNLWIGAESGLYRRLVDGSTERYTIRHGLPVNQIRAIFEDGDGQLWVGTRLGLCQLASKPNYSGSIVSHVYTETDGLPSKNITSIWQSSTGKLWIGLIGGLGELLPRDNQERRKFRAYTSTQGLSDINIWALSEDRDGSLWIGSENGVMKLARSGFISYGKADGLGDPAIASIFEDQAGELCVTSITGSIFLNRFNGTRFAAAKPRFPKDIDYYGWGWDQLSLQDHVGEWWIPTGQGLCRFPKLSNPEYLARVIPRVVYTSRNGLPFDDVFRLFEDARGDIWIATFSERGNGLTRVGKSNRDLS